MRIKLSINLPWPVATLFVGLIGALLCGVALLNYYSIKRINEFEALATSSPKQLTDSNQAQAIKDAQVELQANKIELAKTDEKIKNLELAVGAQGKDLVITSSDVSPFLTGAIQIICVNEKGEASIGSGSLIKLQEIPHAVLTNYHVVKNQKSCVAHITNLANDTIGAFLLTGTVYSFNTNTDTAVVALGDSLSENNAPIDSYNFSLSSLRKCPSNLPVGTPLVIIGYPTFAKRGSKVTIPKFGTIEEVYRTVTNGIISGYDTSLTTPRGALPYQNFFISAKIDAGNSGGISLAKDPQGLCVLGLPTWLSMGTYENLGLVQNIANIIPKKQ